MIELPEKWEETLAGGADGVDLALYQHAHDTRRSECCLILNDAERQGDEGLAKIHRRDICRRLGVEVPKLGEVVVLCETPYCVEPRHYTLGSSIRTPGDVMDAFRELRMPESLAVLDEALEEVVGTLALDIATGCWVVADKFIGRDTRKTPYILARNDRGEVIERGICRTVVEKVFGIRFDKRSVRIDTTCGNRRCINPAHYVIGPAVAQAIIDRCQGTVQAPPDPPDLSPTPEPEDFMSHPDYEPTFLDTAFRKALLHLMRNDEEVRETARDLMRSFAPPSTGLPDVPPELVQRAIASTFGAIADSLRTPT